MAVASVVPAVSPKYSPIGITFTQFLRFDISDGNRRIKVVQEIREQGDWDVSRDFYLGFRQKIRAGVRDDDLSGEDLVAYARGSIRTSSCAEFGCSEATTLIRPRSKSVAFHCNPKSSWEAEGQKWDSQFKFVRFPWKGPNEPLERWVPYFERSIQEAS